MMDLMKGEIYKVYKSTFCRVLFLLYAATAVAICYFANQNSLLIDKSDNGDLTQFVTRIIKQSPLTVTGLNEAAVFLGVIFGLGILSSLFMAPVWTSYFVTVEYSTRSLQQLIGKGIPRNRIVYAKFIVMNLLILTVNLAVIMMEFVAMIVTKGSGEIVHFGVPILLFIIKMSCMNLLFMTIGMCLAYCFRTSAASMPVSLICILYIFSMAGQSIVDENSILSIGAMLLLTFVFLYITVIIFRNRDI